MAAVVDEALMNELVLDFESDALTLTTVTSELLLTCGLVAEG